jgi:hypothetical protein
MANVSSNNLTTLYSGGGVNIRPTSAYGNANVVSLLNAGTDGGNTVTNIVATGNMTIDTITANSNITADYYFGNGAFLTGLTNLVVANANYANFAGTAFSVAGANVSGIVANANYASFANIANTANLATFATTANAVAGANVSGIVANANYSAFANVAASANSVAVANVVGIGNIAVLNLDGSSSNVLFGNGVFAPESTSIANANYANFAGTAFSVSGSNVSGEVANANYASFANVASIANSVAGANVSGEVANANYASYANIAASANSVAVANVVGIGNIATINLDGSSSNVLFGNGIFAPESTSIANANYANFAGQVVDATQSNITAVGTLTSLAVSGNITGAGNLKIGNILLTEFSSTLVPTNSLQIITDVANANNRSLSIDGGTITSLANVDAGTIIAAGGLTIRGGTMGSDANRISSNTQSIQGGPISINAGLAWGANNQTRVVTGGTISLTSGRGQSANANNITGGAFNANSGGVRWQVGNNISGGGLTIAAGTIQPDIGVSSFSANSVNLSATTFAFGRFTIDTSNGVIGTIRTPLVNFGSGFGLGTSISNGVSNITIGNVIAADQVFFRTPGIGGVAGVSQGNINNVVIGNITTPGLVLESGSWIYPGGSNVSNVSVTGNFTSGRIDIFTGAVNNAASVLGTVTRGNIKLNARNVILEASNTSNSSGTGVFVFDANNTANLGNLVISNNATFSNANVGNLQLNRFQETVYAYGNATGTITPDFVNGSIQNMTLTGNITLNTLGNAITGRSMTLVITQDATGGRTLTSSMKFAGGINTLSTNPNAIDVMSVFYEGATYYATLSRGFV